EQPFIEQVPVNKIYTDKAIGAGTLIGGPLVAGYLIAENFKVFGKNEKAKLAWILAIGATIVLFSAIFLIPGMENFPRQIIPLSYTIIVYFLVQHYQGTDIIAHISSGGKSFNLWRTTGIGIIGAAITLLLILVIVFITARPAENNLSSSEYGNLKHEIDFDKNNISQFEVDRIANRLTQATFFDEEKQKYIILKKVDSTYEISIPIINSAWEDPEAVSFFQQLQKDLQSKFRDYRIVINMCDEQEITSIKKRIE
ncbi:MAG: hypothetical protein WAT91_06220, partial [Saprospiraceae bacterium]